VDVFSIEQILQLLQAAWDDSPDDWLLLAVTFICALRRAEAVGLKPENIIGSHIVVKRGKGSKPVRRLLLQHQNPLLNVRAALIEKALKTQSGCRMFPISARTFQRRVHRYGEAAGLPKLLCHPHTLRHSIIQFLRDNDMKLEEIQEISGHVRLDSLRRYLHPQSAVIEAKFNRALGATE